MSTSTDIPVLNRPAFFDGQRLTAADLGAVQAFHRELRWLQNRALHNWGIAFGFVVTGGRGDRTVHVQPGYAIDCKGRDLILGQPREMPIPVVAGASDGGPVTYFLTASYAEDEDLTPETRTGTCGTSGAVRRPEQPILRWQDPDDRGPDSGFRHGLDVVLASISVQNCQLTEDVSGAERRDALPAQQPYVAAGQTPPGQTVWRRWPESDDAEAVFVGVAATVPTTEAGFRTTPSYYAHIVGRRTFTFEQVDPDGNTGTRAAVVDGYVQVSDPTPSSFEMLAILPIGALGSEVGQNSVTLNPPVVLESEFPARLEQELDWYVVWIGIEG